MSYTLDDIFVLDPHASAYRFLSLVVNEMWMYEHFYTHNIKNNPFTFTMNSKQKNSTLMYV